MPKTRKNVKELTAHVVSTLSAKEDLPDFIKETLQKVVDNSASHEDILKSIIKITIDIENFEKKFKDSLVNANSNIKKAYYFLKGDNDNKIKEYFGKITPSKVDGKLKETKSLLKNILKVVENDTHNDLNDYKTKFESDIQSINSFKDEIYNAETDKKLLDNDEEKAYDKWEIVYGRLKFYVRGLFYKTGVDYRIFFLDMGVSASKPKGKEEVKDVANNVLEEKPPVDNK
jgi:hypothetical protein